MRQLLARLCLAGAIALAAPGAYAHALTHVGEALEGLHHHHDGEGDAHQERYGCALDAAFAGSDALSAGASISSSPSAPASAPVLPPASRTVPCEALERFASRAPPFSR